MSQVFIGINFQCHYDKKLEKVIKKKNVLANKNIADMVPYQRLIFSSLVLKLKKILKLIEVFIST